MDVAPEVLAFAPDDQRLGVDLQVGEAVDDVNSRTLERP